MAIRLVTISYLILCICLSTQAQTPSRFEIVIDEIFPDPSPQIGLPNAEFIELRNVSSIPYNLNGWKINNHSSSTTIKSNFILQPDSFVVICPNSAVDSYLSFGAAIGVTSFPSLDNDGDIITLQSPEGIFIHTVSYDKSTYRNDIKTNGGWSLEMIDTKSPCASNNWTSTKDPKGGTPCMKNSVDAINADQISPALLRTYTIDSITIRAVFDEPLDSATASISTNYHFDNDLDFAVSASPIAPLFNEVELKIPLKMDRNRVYNLTVNNITDCTGNEIGMMNIAKVGLPAAADTGDIVINEILFNPKTNGYDYVELYNRSNKIVDMKQLSFANKNFSGSFINSIQLTAGSFLFFPNEYYVFTENSNSLSQQYTVKNLDHVLELSALPSMPDDHGNIFLLNQSATAVDSLDYDHSWHFGLIDNEDGVALERVDYNQPTQRKDNWTSAASTSGYGTPTYQNSQFKNGPQSNSEFTITPKTFSPDNDGYEDYCFINYHVASSGYAANITIYDVAGRVVRYLAKNVILGTEGNFRWDGLDEKMQKLSMGIYIVLTEVYNLEGYTKKFKTAVVLARKF